MALKFLIQAMNPLERMTASVFLRHCAGAKTTAGVTLPERPKRPFTGYVQFVSDTMGKLKQEMPGAKSTEMLVKASTMWKNLDPAKRKRYNDEYVVNRDKWIAAMARFEASLSAQARDQLVAAERRAREERRDDREKRHRRRLLVEHDKPRKPANAFMLYVIDRQATRGDQSQKEFVIQLAKEWATKSDSEKSPFVKRYQDLKEKYQTDLVAWERRMIKQGRADLVRGGSQPVIDSKEVAKHQPR